MDPKTNRPQNPDGFGEFGNDEFGPCMISLRVSVQVQMVHEPAIYADQLIVFEGSMGRHI